MLIYLFQSLLVLLLIEGIIGLNLLFVNILVDIYKELKNKLKKDR